MSYESMLTIDGYDNCLLGIAEAWDTSGNRPLRLVYDGNKMLLRLQKEGMSHDEALEWISFNIEGAFVGPQTPIVCWPHTMRDVKELMEEGEGL